MTNSTRLARRWQPQDVTHPGAFTHTARPTEFEFLQFPSPPPSGIEVALTLGGLYVASNRALDPVQAVVVVAPLQRGQHERARWLSSLSSGSGRGHKLRRKPSGGRLLSLVPREIPRYSPLS